jgi:hypothetical protein
MERHNLYMSLAPRVEHPQSVEPPPLNMRRCYMDVEDNHESRARAVAEKSPIATDQLKKRVGSSWANKSLEDVTRKRRRMVQDWLVDEDDEDTSAYMLNPRKKRSEQTMQGGLTPPIKGPQEDQTPPVGSTPSVRTAEEQARPPPQDGGQGSSAQHTSQGQPRRRSFTTIHRTSDL